MPPALGGAAGWERKYNSAVAARAFGAAREKSGRYATLTAPQTATATPTAVR